MAPKRKRSGSSLEEADAARVEKQGVKDELENVRQSNAENDGKESKTSTQLCETCEKMTSDEGEVSGTKQLVSVSGYPHYNKHDLEKSARSGCKSCVLLWAEASGPGDWGQELSWWIGGSVQHAIMTAINAQGVPIIIPWNLIPTRAADVFVGQNKLDSLRFQRPSSNEHSFPAIEIAITADEGDPMAKHVANRPFAVDVDSLLVTKAAKEWLSRCLTDKEGHETCPKRRTTPLLPTIAIFVGENESQVRLHNSKNGEQADYIALSYCWGGPQALTTTTETLEKFVEGLDVSSLPQTIRDAILTTRSLGINYLWVDALCILQDSDLDKIHEIDAMGGYYKNSTLTIAAATASAATGGFLHRRPPLPSCELKLGNGKVFMTRKYKMERPKEPLYTRAWALQEFLLSPRLLIFGSREVVWQCHSTIASVLPSAITYDPSWPCNRLPFIYQSSSEHEKSLPQSSHCLNDRDLYDRRSIWGSIVTDYTSRALTFSEDRLPALEGVARELENVWNDTYIAGMWRSQLLTWLLWKSNCKANNYPEGRLRAPSWSWAAVDGVITFPWASWQRWPMEAKASAEIRHVDGAVGGQLRLFATIKSLMAVKDVRERQRECVPRHLVDDDSEIEDDGTLQFVLLGFDILGAFGLIVRPVAGPKYERVGMLCTYLPLSLDWWGGEKKTVTII